MWRTCLAFWPKRMPNLVQVGSLSVSGGAACLPNLTFVGRALAVFGDFWHLSRFSGSNVAKFEHVWATSSKFGRCSMKCDPSLPKLTQFGRCSVSGGVVFAEL